MLIGRELTKLFHGRRVLDGVAFSCGPAEVCAILGENGTGKSTLLRVCSGLLEPDAGSVTIQGHELTGGGVAARAQLGYVPDGTQSLPDLSLRELAALVSSLKRVPDGAAAQRALFGWRERLALNEAWHQRLSSLSFGQRKRACLLAALIGDPWLLILDEPSNGLDPAGVTLMLELIEQRRSQGQATLLACNDSAFLAQLRATRYRLHDGKLQSA
jgi:ABC-type multidrug transport system ATPase subunit